MGALVGFVFPSLAVVIKEGEWLDHAIKVRRRIVAKGNKHFVDSLKVLTNDVHPEVDCCDVVAGDYVDGKKADNFLPVFSFTKPLVRLDVVLTAKF